MNGAGPNTYDRNGFSIVAASISALWLPLSIIEAGWAPGALALPIVCVSGLLLGALSAHLELPRAIRWPLMLISGVAAGMVATGSFKTGIEPALTRLTMWSYDLLAGRVIDDAAFVTFWVTLLVWWAAFNATHGIASNGWALEAMLPTLLPLSLNAIYTRQNPVYVLLALFGMIMLMAWSAQGASRAGWVRRGLDYPTELWPEWLGSGLVAAGLACALGLGLATFTSHTTIAWLERALARPVAQVRQTAERLLGGAPHRPTADQPGRTSAILPTARLVNAPPQLSDEVVMWVWTQATPGWAESQAGWRGLTYSTYSGRGWSNPTPHSRPLPGLSAAEPPSRLLTQQFEIVAPHGNTLFAVNQPIAAASDVAGLYISETSLIGLQGTTSHYTVTSRLIVASENELRQSPPIYPPEIELYLQLPPTLPRRVRDLAQQVAAGAPTPYDKALAIQAFVRTYSYTLDLPPLPAGRDLVDYFLFDASGGYCDYYASAMVVMLRAVGVPARLASGFTQGMYDSGRGAYRVTAADAHSWPEVYFAGIGWVEFEPTAARPTWQRMQTTPGLSAEQVHRSQLWRKRLISAATGATVLTIAAAALFIYILWRERRLAVLPPAELVSVLYARLRRTGAWLGLETRASDTPDEFVSALNRRLAELGRRPAHVQVARQAAACIGQLYRLASYGSRSLTAQDAAAALDAWRTLVWHGGLAWLSSLDFIEFLPILRSK